MITCDFVIMWSSGAMTNETPYDSIYNIRRFKLKRLKWQANFSEPWKLNNNPIKELPETILKCTNLEVLDVKENFTKIWIITIYYFHDCGTRSKLPRTSCRYDIFTSRAAIVLILCEIENKNTNLISIPNRLQRMPNLRDLRANVSAVSTMVIK